MTLPAMGASDRGSLDALRREFGERIEVCRVSAEEARAAAADLRHRGIMSHLSTSLVWHVMQGGKAACTEQPSEAGNNLAFVGSGQMGSARIVGLSVDGFVCKQHNPLFHQPFPSLPGADHCLV
jgi:hypothetical protein